MTQMYCQTEDHVSSISPGQRFSAPAPGLCVTRVGRSPPSVLGGIQLSSLPWSSAGPSTTTFGLALHGSAVSSRTPPNSGFLRHRIWRSGSRFCSVANRLRLRFSASCILQRGRNFPRETPWPAHRLASLEQSRLGAPYSFLRAGKTCPVYRGDKIARIGA